MHVKEVSKTNNILSLLSLKKRRPLSGSMTVETALVLPIFLFAMMSVMYLTDGVRASAENTGLLAEKAYKAAKYAYVGNLAVDKTGLSGAIDIVMKDDIIDLKRSHEIDIAVGIKGLYTPHAVERVRVRAYTGYDNSHPTSTTDRTPEEMVYVTENGTVYHRSLSCKHLKLNIRQIGYGSVAGERANDGSKYYPCEHCARGGTPSSVYITDDGNRYHTTLSCPGLKRTIREVPLSTVGLPPCSNCGH